MEPLEVKEIRGLTFRNIIAIILATITIVSTVLVKTSSIETEITSIKNDQATYGKINDMNFKISDAHSLTLQDEIDEIKRRLNDLESKQLKK